MARWVLGPAPTIAACGGTMTRLANRPPIIPKFESEQWSRALAQLFGGIERAIGVSPQAVEAGPQVRYAAHRDIAQHRNDEAALGIDGDAEIDARDMASFSNTQLNE